MNGLENDLHKDPAVVAVASDGEILRPNGSPLFPSEQFYPPVSMDSIQSQTFTNQNFMGHPPFVPVSLVQVSNSLAALRINPVSSASVVVQAEKQILQQQNVSPAKRQEVDSVPVQIPNASADKNEPSQPSETTSNKKVEATINGTGGGGNYNKRYQGGNGSRVGGGDRGPRTNNGNGSRNERYFPRNGRSNGPKNGHFGGQFRSQDGNGAAVGGDQANIGGHGAAPRAGNFRSHSGGGNGTRAYLIAAPHKFGNQPKFPPQQQQAGPQ